MTVAKENSVKRQYLKALSVATIASSMVGYSTVSNAGATFKIDDTKWVSVGAGFRTSFTATEEGAAGTKWSNSFSVDNMRLYLNAQLHEYIKLEFNTECQFCGSNGGEMKILDAIGKFEFNEYINIWVGRMLVPAERREMNGPFYSANYNVFATGTPFESADFAGPGSGVGSGTAGLYGRDDGATLWGSAFEGRLQYAVGVFNGLRSNAGSGVANPVGNADDNLLYAQRIAYNFWDVEKNPGYYTSGTYYGAGGDILTLGVSNQYQEDGAGTPTDEGDFRGTAVDLLMEKVLGNGGVITFNGEYKNYAVSSGCSQATRDSTTPGWNMFEGDAYDIGAMYLFPQKFYIGQFQPFIRYTNTMPTNSSDRDAYEAGVNYIIDGHNAKIMLNWHYGDRTTKGLDYSSDATGDDVHSITLGLQLQI